MSEKTAAIIGATGMIGTYLTNLLLEDKYFSTVRLIVRRPLPKTNPKMEVKLVDFTDTESLKLALESTDVIFCCIGTTQKNVKGNKELYRKIDFDIPVKTAMLGKETGCEKFIIVSSVGASIKAGSFYLRLKGQVEDALQLTGIRSVHIMQPSMLMGNRKENRPTERILNGPLKILSKLFIGGFRKYRSIEGEVVAKAMVNAAKLDYPGVFKYTYDQILALAR
jgi:uncharacterized protein YbjT (DUF2867 family)